MRPSELVSDTPWDHRSKEGRVLTVLYRLETPVKARRIASETYDLDTRSTANVLQLLEHHGYVHRIEQPGADAYELTTP